MCRPNRINSRKTIRTLADRDFTYVAYFIGIEIVEQSKRPLTATAHLCFTPLKTNNAKINFDESVSTESFLLMETGRANDSFHDFDNVTDQVIMGHEVVKLY